MCVEGSVDGRSLVMSDWQRCVDWLLVKYCRRKLRLDWCWCRWRTSAKGLCQWASRCGETSRLGSRDPAASGIKCGLHGGKNNKMKSCAVPWLGLKAKTEPGRSWGPSHEWDWCGGHTKPMGFAVVHHKTTGFLGWATKPKLKTEVLQHQVGLTGRSDQYDRCASWASGDFEAEDICQDRKACIEAKQGAVIGHPSDGVTIRFPKVPFGGVYLTFM
jgi:hypothetical protein